MTAVRAPKQGRLRLGELLVESGAISPEQLNRALAEQARVKQPLGQVLFRLKLVTDETFRRALSLQLRIPFVDLDKMVIDPALAKIVPSSYARQRRAVPVTRIGQMLTVALDDPTNTATIDELAKLTRYSISVVTATQQALQGALHRLYDARPAAPLTAIAPTTGRTTAPDPATVVKMKARRPSIVDGQHKPSGADDLFSDVLERAIELRASDIHIEMLTGGLSIRTRVDGVLRKAEFGEKQKQLDASAREIVSRIKILAKLDIAERRRPQDGSFRVVVERNRQDVPVDLRVSCVPCYAGESVVIRLQDRSKAPNSIKDLDLSPEVASRLHELLTRTTGLFLVTGPTGSGKSTTLYACLSMLAKPEVRVLTVEDPVEFVYEGLSQSEVDTDIGNTFASYLRVFLRHDPEVIMVGEIRDQETAEMAFRAAQTGHLLLSTLHTNSALAALPRLLDLKIEPSLVAASLIGVLSQRLVRKICSKCRTVDHPSADATSVLFGTVPKGFVFYRGAGCSACGNTGYKGRMMLADLWVPDAQDLALIARGVLLEEVKQSARRTSISMATDALGRLKAGLTTIDELLRVMPNSAVAEHRAMFPSPAVAQSV